MTPPAKPSGGFSLDGYVDVAERIREFKAKHPEGSLQPASPWRIEFIADSYFVVYDAAAYRYPEDMRPGIGTAWEPFPGKTPYTRDSELQNAETSAWGRAIVAALASDTQKVASAQEVRNRQADRDAPPDPDASTVQEREAARALLKSQPDETRETMRRWCAEQGIEMRSGTLTRETLARVRERLTFVLEVDPFPTDGELVEEPPLTWPSDTSGAIETSRGAIAVDEAPEPEHVAAVKESLEQQVERAKTARASGPSPTHRQTPE